MNVTRRIVLVGLSGSGKSTVAAQLATTLSWTCIDMDAEIESRFGRTIPDIFRDEGEAAFRVAEREILSNALRRDEVVIATGGGAVVPPETWGEELLGRAGTLVIALEVTPDVALGRLLAQQAAEGSAVERPLLAGNDPLGRLTSLKENRQDVYDRAAISLVADRATPEIVAGEIAGLLPRMLELERPDVCLRTQSAESRIFVQPDSLSQLGALTRARWPKALRAWIVTDERVGPLHGAITQRVLEEADFSVQIRPVPAGEVSKSLSAVSLLLDWLLEGGVERSDVVVALGGGMVGDLAGFVAAICLRGIGLVQVPTTLLATVDSSVGGKTGVNHRTGKNLIGAFYQPPLVVIDPALLQTLPPRELTSGWAEIVKHALIQPSTPGGERADLLTFLERNADRLAALAEPALTYLIRRNVALKAAVVEADERESGIRAYLNFGHTLGHAIEAADYRHLHGEAVALGMRAVSRLGVEHGTFDEGERDRLESLLSRFGLPSRVGVDPERVMELIHSDKKKSAGRLRWVLPVREGGVTIRNDVPEERARKALASLLVDQPS